MRELRASFSRYLSEEDHVQGRSSHLLSAITLICKAHFQLSMISRKALSRNGRTAFLINPVE
jgi:hypothetical protein